ncbi:hypothetical protein [Gemmobacter sp.]|uniref:hypothetical protein n=1 Tax=Gemmobacter sp. TaxID=1898957 RepID=UPI002AFEA2DD|nr:hypothetical protein [Gemmobacter sp.]
MTRANSASSPSTPLAMVMTSRCADRTGRSARAAARSAAGTGWSKRSSPVTETLASPIATKRCA